MPRTSSPLDPALIRPHTPVSPSSTLDSVFIDDNIGNQFGSIGDGADFRPDINLKGPCQSENISKSNLQLDPNMATLDEEEKKLRTLRRKINAKISLALKLNYDSYIQ